MDPVQSHKIVDEEELAHQKRLREKFYSNLRLTREREARTGRCERVLQEYNWLTSDMQKEWESRANEQSWRQRAEERRARSQQQRLVLQGQPPERLQLLYGRFSVPDTAPTSPSRP